MKKKIKIVLIVISVILLGVIIYLLYTTDINNNYYYDDVILSLPNHKYYDCYISDVENKEKNDYCQYYYEKDIKSSLGSKFILVDKDNIDEVKSHYSDFIATLKERKVINTLKLRESHINEGDYFYLINRKFVNKEETKDFEYYNLYYYDSEYMVLYFIHNND